MNQNKQNPTIALSILVSYDYEFLMKALPLIYPYVSFVLIAIDKNRKAWKGDSFEIPDDFFTWLKNIDTDRKINIFEYEVDYTLPSIVIETYLRNEMGKRCPPSDWYMQLDTDEYIINPEKIFQELEKIKTDPQQQTMVYTKVLPMFQSDENNHFVIDIFEEFPMLTNIPKYDHARISNTAEKKTADLLFLHQSWDRKAEEVMMKIKNWGHNNDFDTISFFNFWQSINYDNYKYIKNLHPFAPSKWPALIAIPKNESNIVNPSMANFLQEKVDAQKAQLEESKKLKSKIKRFLTRLYHSI
ncbi:hypothetical protein [Epilithonimonas lactis]|nr:hypothetical protein [Epilithonimonas lactis]SEQ16457.1 hypothetical protein SAMN04488097_1527 [Epilithonimonas lactis]